MLALVVGLIAGGLGGGLAGYAISNHNDDSALAAAAASQTPALAEDTSTGATPNDGTPTDQSLSDIVARVNPAVVTITNSLAPQAGVFGQMQGATAEGTGIIIDKDGHIVTNNHVIDGEHALKVTFSDGTEAPATLVGADPFQDVAVIKVDVPVPATVAFGDSDAVRAGDSVVAIGSALGEFHNTVTNGIVSATGRSLDTGEGYRLGNLIQHNAPISPGNSGGPLLDAQGEVIGMNTAVVRGGGNGATAEGLGFAIASNTVQRIAQQLMQTGQADYPYLGVQFADARQSDSNLPGGALLTAVVSGGPAASAGLTAGDIITAVDGTMIDDDNPFLNLVFAHKPGDTVQLAVTHRDGSTAAVTLTLGTRPAQP